MPQFIPPTPSKISAVVTFDCGCICEFPLKGSFAEQRDWHVIPCRYHTENRGDVAQLAERVELSATVARVKVSGPNPNQ